jgi:hypothetical protein
VYHKQGKIEKKNPPYTASIFLGRSWYVLWRVKTLRGLRGRGISMLPPVCLIL